MNTSNENRSLTTQAAKLALAASAAALFAAATVTPAFAADAEHVIEVKCQGINACKGQT